MKPPKLILLALNEINFDLVQRYLAHYSLPGFRQLLSSFKRIETFAEEQYTQLEPWIQWVSVHTGKVYDEHRIFRLGDMVHSDLPQIFECLEQRGLTVGAVSPMNSRNNLKNPAYFIPDPWTATAEDGSPFSKRLAEMLRQTVNDNAKGRISVSSLVTIGEAIARTGSLSLTPRLLSLIARSRKTPWLKALVLDQLIHMVHVHLMRRHQPDVSYVFLNAGAHIQHHYFFNSPHADVSAKNPDWYVPPDADPIRDMLLVYDRILQDYLRIATGKCRLFVATGLTQVPYDKVKFYYRLTNHRMFLKGLGLEYVDVLPRMTRDFEVVFADRASAQTCISTLASMRMQGDSLPLFAEVEDRGLSLFATLTYPKEIPAGAKVSFDGGSIEDFSALVEFVAIKNGMHASKGFAFIGPNAPSQTPHVPVHVARLYDLIYHAACE